ncbi:hypothetical protein BCV70DRAFT_216837 [Testicularia cyperi]|uniref:Histone chaperone domain-containing protein n=1 Tax=Testicularia cyperi TaxID=1882483 RepID=A0A317XTQ9_9BASI|nr:hypothetical protein BCV70DRAFT_216837 [Testicularia cyperi]
MSDQNDAHSASTLAGLASTPSQTEAPITSSDKGKGKARAIEPEPTHNDEEDDGIDDSDDDDEESGEDEEDLDVSLDDDDEDFEEIDPSNIVYTGRRRNAPLDYSSEEALRQAGLDKDVNTTTAEEQEEDDTEFKGEDMHED